MLPTTVSNLSANMGNDFELVDGFNEGWSDDYREEYWAQMHSSKTYMPTTVSLDSPEPLSIQWISTSVGFESSFQTHFVTFKYQNTFPICIVFFIGGVKNPKVYSLCTSSSCRHTLDNITLFYGTDNFEETTENSGKFCIHAYTVGLKVLQHHGYSFTESISENFPQLLFNSVTVSNSEITGVYVANDEYESKGRPLLFVDDNFHVSQVFFWNKKFWCHFCKKGFEKQCRHVRHAESMNDSGNWGNILDDLNRSTVGDMAFTNGYFHSEKAHQLKIQVANEFSSKFINMGSLWSFSDQQYSTISCKRAHNLKNWLKKNFFINSGDNSFIIKPEKKKCSECQSILALRNVHGQSFIYAQSMFPCKIFQRTCENTTCSNFQKNNSYSGKYSFIANFQNRMLFPLEIVEEYLRLYASSGLSVNSWWEQKCSFYARQCNAKNIKKTFHWLKRKRGSVVTALCGAAENLSLKSAYKCCKCPRVVSMDGIVLSTARFASPNFSQPWKINCTERSRASKREDRQLTALLDWELAILLDFKNSKKGLTDCSIENSVKKTRNNAFKLLLSICLENKNSSGNHFCHNSLLNFAHFISSRVAPVISLIPYDYWDCLITIREKHDETPHSILNEISENSPVLFSLVTTIKKKNSSRRKILWPIFDAFAEELLVKKKNTYYCFEDDLFVNLSKDEQNNIPENFEYKHSLSDDLDELWSTGIYFPHFPITRKVKNVVMCKADREKCYKETVNDAKCMPGVLLFYCVEHEVCIGFVVLSNPESPKIAYEILATRFPVLPEIIIYDNGCNLSEYILNRTPYLFRRTQILVDAFHFHSHISCASTFSTETNYKISQHLNTSLFEQRNSRLAKLKMTAPLMRIRVFMAFLRFAVANLNYKRKHNDVQKKYIAKKIFH